MARIRTVKPEFWTDERIGECSTSARLLFIATFTFADDNGNLQRSAKQLKAQALPYDSVDCEPLLQELLSQGLLIEYTSDGGKYLHISNFNKHQKIDKPSKPRCPAYTNSGNIDPELGEDSPSPRAGREGKGKEGNNNTDDHGSSLPKGWPKNWTPAMEDQLKKLKAIYPSRGGANQPWARARKAINARLREDHTWEQILEGARRYAKFCQITGKVETETVMQAATFCGPDTLGFTEPWTIPKKPLSLEQANRICVRQVKTRRTAETDEEFIDRMRKFA